MKLELATAHQILLELSKTDLLRFDLSVEGLLQPSAQTRAQICRLLSAVSTETGQTFRMGNGAHFDVLPDLQGGCLLIVSDCVREEAKLQPSAFFTREINELIDAARAVCAAISAPRVTLLESGGGFLLLTDCQHQQTRRLLSEFLCPVHLSYMTCVILRERSRVLLDDALLSALCGGA